MVLIIDNYDSFTYNLAQYVGETGRDVRVVRNDRMGLEDIKALMPSHVIISPGPGAPPEAGLSCEVIRFFANKIPVLGICLGHQCIAAAFNGRIVRARRVVHGKTSEIYHSGQGVFQGLPSPFEATRYHSLIVEEDDLPENIDITAHTSDGEIMGIKINSQRVEGLQFHPESVLTRHGRQLLRNFLQSR
jgi:anthranilate synthase/aminodeoxychorismate synthase-like glutamine amidotransferase